MERVKQYFIARGSQELADRIIRLPESGATVDLCAAALKCEPGEIAKAVCLIVKNPAKIHYDAVPLTADALLDASATVDSTKATPSPTGAGSPTSASTNKTSEDDGEEANLPIIIICAGDTKMNQTKYKKIFACPPKMVKKDECLEASGHPVGAVCPFAVAKRTQVFLDISIKRFPRLFPAAGDHNYGIWVTPDELQTYGDHVVGWVDVCELAERKTGENGTAS